jgi:hypothetical protein
MSDVKGDLSNATEQVDTTMDVVIIKKVDHDIPGGKTLDTTGITETVLKAGRVVIIETATGKLKPLAIITGAYEALPAGHTYKGILIATILTKRPFASVMLAGDVNEGAVINYDLPAIPAGAKTALTHILFTKD